MSRQQKPATPRRTHPLLIDGLTINIDREGVQAYFTYDLETRELRVEVVPAQTRFTSPPKPTPAWASPHPP